MTNIGFICITKKIHMYIVYTIYIIHMYFPSYSSSSKRILKYVFEYTCLIVLFKSRNTCICYGNHNFVIILLLWLILGMVFAVSVLSRHLKIDDLLIVVVACSFDTVAAICYSFITQSWQIYFSKYLTVAFRINKIILC